jgi:uncharacterized membrane protein
MVTVNKSTLSRPSRIFIGIGFAAVALLGYLARRLPPDGVERSVTAQFVGRLHPLLVHAPIVLILLVPLFEFVGAFERWRDLRAAAGFLLGLSAIASIFAAFDGWLLARSGGYGGLLVTGHLWGGVWLAGLSLVAVALRGVSAGYPVRTAAYRVLLVSMVGLLFWTSDQGGMLTHGDTFLTEYMPGRLRSLLGVAPAKAKPAVAGAAPVAATFYSERIVPLFDRDCISCHGPQKAKGGLRMDSYAALMKGGEDGPVIAPWLPQKSDLYRRITLPHNDDDFMPTDGKKPLSDADVEVIRQWIAAGASDREPVEAGK